MTQPLTNADQAVVHKMVANAIMTRTEMINKMLDRNGRNLDLDCGYPSPNELTPQRYRAMYDRNGIAARVVAMYPEGCWTEDPEVYEVEDQDEDTEFEQAFDAFVKAHHIWHYLFRLDVLSGIGHFGAMLLGFDDAGNGLDKPVTGYKDRRILPGQQPEEEQVQGEMVKNAESTRKLLFMRPFDEACVSISSWDTNVASPRFGLPEFYNFTIASTTSVNSTSVEPTLTLETARVHWTRVLHAADNCESSEVFGVPRQRDVYNNLLDVRKLLGCSAEMFWQGAFPGFAFELNPDVADPEIDSESIRKEFQNYMNRLQRYIAVQGVSAKSLSPQVADPEHHLQVQLLAIAIAKAVPLRILQGSEEAKLASSQDMKTWNKRLANRQRTYLGPKLIRPFVQRMIDCGVLPTPQQDFCVDFVDLNALSDLERADIATKQTDAMAKYVGGGVETLVPPMEYLTEFLGFDQEKAEAILEAALDHVSDLMDEASDATPQGATEPTPEFDGDEVFEQGRRAGKFGQTPPSNKPQPVQKK